LAKSLVFFGLLAVVGRVCAIGRVQSAGAFGRLTCNGEPAVGVLVRLYDDDRSDIDDLLAETHTDEDGSYHLEGWTDEFSTIDPKLNFYHDCNDNLPCQLKFTINIPDMYISQSKEPEKYFDGGVLPLEASYPGQSRDCIHFSFVKLSQQADGPKPLV